MTDTLINFYMYFGALFAVIISLGQLAQKKKSFFNYIYSFSFLGLGVWFFHISLYSSGTFDQYYGAFIFKLICIPVTFMVPPLMVLRYKWIIRRNFQFTKRYLFLFLPSFFSLLIILYPLTGNIPLEKELLIFNPIMSEHFNDLHWYYQLILLLFPMPKIYLVLSLFPTLVSMITVWKKANAKKMRVSRIGYIFAFLIVTSNVLAFTGDFFSRELVRYAMVMAHTTMCCLYLITQRQPDYNSLLKIETRKAQYEKSRIKGLDIENILLRLYEIMEDEKAYADEELSLKDLSNDLSLSPHQLSQILNEQVKKNFNTFVNEYRVDEAKSLLIEQPDRSILSIGNAAGFNSTTTFNTVFAKYTGLSPRQYRNKVLKNS